MYWVWEFTEIDITNLTIFLKQSEQVVLYFQWILPLVELSTGFRRCLLTENEKANLKFDVIAQGYAYILFHKAFLLLKR